MLGGRKKIVHDRTTKEKAAHGKGKFPQEPLYFEKKRNA